MGMPASPGSRQPCACGCGTLVAGTWARGHASRGRARPAVDPLPAPEIEDELEDVGELEPEAALGPAVPPPGPGSPPGDRPAPAAVDPRPRVRDRLRAAAGLLAAAGEDDREPVLPPDPEPAHLGPGPADSSPRRGRPGRVTVVMRKDIEAKAGLMLEIPGRVWAVRDPYCGAAFVQQLPAIRAAVVDLICQSPDLVEWFCGTGGGFILWLNLAAACQPPCGRSRTG